MDSNRVTAVGGRRAAGTSRAGARRLLFSLPALALAALIALFALAVAHADTLSIDFESYSLGLIDGQDGWSSTGSAGSGCAVYDVEVVSNTYGYGSFGTQSLRMSNAVTSGCFGDQTFSKSLTDEAGETSAVNDGLSGGTRQTHFEAEWDFASTVPGAEQPGLSVVASPDRGDGARMSWVQMADTPAGLEVNFYDYQTGVNEVGCVNGDNFIFSNVASGLDRTVPHTIKIAMDFIDGPSNDHVKVFVDGVLMHKGTSWEDYFIECESNPTRPVDSILFRVGGTAAPATAGDGFVIDNLTMTSRASEAGDAKPTETATPGPLVGGIVVDPDLSALGLQSDASSGSSSSLIAMLIAGGVATAMALGGGMWWYARRRPVQ